MNSFLKTACQVHNQLIIKSLESKTEVLAILQGQVEKNGSLVSTLKKNGPNYSSNDLTEIHRLKENSRISNTVQVLWSGG